jgi:hypothetical protein
MRREAEIIKIIDRTVIEGDSRTAHRIGKQGYLYSERTHTGFPFLFEYKDGSGLRGSRIGAVRRLPNYVVVVTKNSIYIFKYLNNEKSFYERYKANEATIEDVYDFIDEWHNSGVYAEEYSKMMGLNEDLIKELIGAKDERELHEYLGMPEEKYDEFLEKNTLS